MTGKKHVKIIHFVLEFRQIKQSWTASNEASYGLLPVRSPQALLKCFDDITVNQCVDSIALSIIFSLRQAKPSWSCHEINHAIFASCLPKQFWLSIIGEYYLLEEFRFNLLTHIYIMNISSLRPGITIPGVFKKAHGYGT